jgi:hypothetical protein
MNPKSQAAPTMDHKIANVGMHDPCTVHTCLACPTAIFCILYISLCSTLADA